MMEARHTLAGDAVVRLIAGPLLRGAFREVRIVGEGRDEGTPVLLLANHFCWWDGFIQYRLNRARFGRRLYAMMLEEQLAKHPFLARCGCFPVRKGSRSVVESLDYALGLLRLPDTMLVLFPQGGIESMHIDRPAFHAGARYLFERMDTGAQVLFNVNLPDYGTGRKPFLVCHYRMVPRREIPDGEALRQEWTRFYAACKTDRTAL